MAKLDLRQGESLDIFCDPNINYFINFSDFDQMDSGYTLKVDEGGANEKIYSVGSGLTIEPETNSLIWHLDSSIFPAGRYSGSLLSDSQISGIYVFIKVTIIVS